MHRAAATGMLVALQPMQMLQRTGRSFVERATQQRTYQTSSLATPVVLAASRAPRAALRRWVTGKRVPASHLPFNAGMPTTSKPSLAEGELACVVMQAASHSAADCNVFASESELQSWLSQVEVTAGVDMLINKIEPGSAVDTTAAGFDASDYTTWQALPTDRLPRGNAALLKRRFLCHCHGTSAVQSAIQPGDSDQDSFLANFQAAEGKGR